MGYIELQTEYSKARIENKERDINLLMLGRRKALFRIVSYNIRTGLGTDGVRSIRRIADVLANLNPDIVCLQEVDKRNPRSWLSDQPKFLGMRLDMQDVFQRNIRLPFGGYGNCILSKGKVIHCRCHPLPGRGEPRGLQEVTISFNGSEMTIFCTHLSTEEKVRVEQARAVSNITREVHTPKILCGDMNDVIGSETLSALLEDAVLRDASLEPPECSTCGDVTCGGRRIDFILPDLHFDVKEYHVVDSSASDHLPVIVDLEFAS